MKKLLSVLKTFVCLALCLTIIAGPMDMLGSDQPDWDGTGRIPYYTEK
ncbi:MAG: hypothetical protein IKX99_08005 [Lachnospiraceae bacterium]|nr:hypothetical protein [Lachnospiraceae bacterium]MBR4794950.1 hypothetical protein [Lachnospiraceae bacterium]MBR5790031.1 hypothetical protein [Lachnospiraceae bacterium]